MPNGHHEADEVNPEAYINALFPYGLIEDLVRNLGYVEIDVEKRGDDRYTLSMRQVNERVDANVVEAQLAEIVAQMTHGEWQIMDFRNIVTNSRIAVEIRVARA